MHVSWVFSQEQNCKHYWSMWVSFPRMKIRILIVNAGSTVCFLRGARIIRNSIIFPSLQFLSSRVCADGNGFKTSTMRLGADVIVFSCCQVKDGRRLFFNLLLSPFCSGSDPFGFWGLFLYVCSFLWLNYLSKNSLLKFCVQSSPTKSIGMLSYTFLQSTGKEDIVVPMVRWSLWHDYYRCSKIWVYWSFDNFCTGF